MTLPGTQEFQYSSKPNEESVIVSLSAVLHSETQELASEKTWSTVDYLYIEGAVVLQTARTLDPPQLSIKQQYQVRLTELILDASDDEILIPMSAMADFLRYVHNSPSILEMERGLVGATPDGGVTVAWRKDGRRLSATFVGDSKVMVVKLAPNEPTTAKLIDCRDNLERIVADCKWAHSQNLITS